MAPTMKKKAPKPSKVVKPKKNTKRSTASTKNHRFQSFSERISKLKIDPVRRRRAAEGREELAEDTSTYFGRALEEWRDLNMSRTFTSFSREATPLCDNLPVLLHNEEKIMDLLVEYIQKEDAQALEPLLGLLSHFAHDLDTRFEKHFQRAVATVTAVAAKHPDPAVVEWSFNNLAWLFKYLSRVLIPDLRPLYNLMSPYLGKEAQKPFIVRFAAESLSFLVRKAASVYERDPTSLDLITLHIFEDVQNCADATSTDLYQQGVITLLTEAIKGVQHAVNSSGVAVLQSMLKQMKLLPGSNLGVPVEIVTGTLTSLIHYTTPETFPPIQQAILESIDTAATLENQHELAKCWSQLIFTITTVRKGTRITDWPSLISVLRGLVETGQKSSYFDAETRSSILGSVAVTLQTATLDVVLPALSLLHVIRSEQWTPHFLQFCDLFARFGHERFESFLLPEFQKFVIEQWQGNESSIALLVPRLPSQGKQLSCPEGLQEWLLQQISIPDTLETSYSETSYLGSVSVSLRALSHLKLGEYTLHKIQSKLLDYVDRALDSTEARSHAFCDFALSSCFATLLDGVSEPTSVARLWPMLCSESSRFVNLASFWSNLLRYVESSPPGPEDLDGGYMDELETSLLHCLTMPSHDIRQAALNIMQEIYRLRELQVPGALLTAATIESMPITLESSRAISMNIRKTGSGYSNHQMDAFMQKAIPRYCFGLLHIQLAQAWDDAVNALAEISKTTFGEEVITNLSQKWLGTQPLEAEDYAIGSPQQLLNVDNSNFQVASDFECSNLAKISAISRQVFEAPYNGYPAVEEQFTRDHARISIISQNARQQALKVLNKIPNLAEKKSRMLVPVLLNWAGIAEAETEDGRPTHGWSRKDQKALLAIFSQFTNPRVLFRSQEVYEALLRLCANGDVEIQRSALKAIFAWKDPAVNQFAEHLTNLLDEARFRDEVSVFLQGAGEEEEATVRPEHHSALMPVLLRLLYGRAVAGGKQGQSSRRKTIFVALSRYGESVLAMFVDIALGSAAVRLLENGGLNEDGLNQLKMPLRQQFGMLNMLDDMLETLGAELEPFTTSLLDAIAAHTIKAARQINQIPTDGTLQDGSLLRSIRQVGMQSISKIYAAVNDPQLSSYTTTIARELIAPRLDKFATENTQSISGTLRLLSAWSASSSTAIYLTSDVDGLLSQLAGLLRQESAKDDVRLFVLQDIVDNLLQDQVAPNLTEAHVTDFVRSIGDVVHHQPSKDVLEACVNSFTKLAVHIKNDKEAHAVLEVCTELLKRPSMVVSPTTKTGLLQTLSPLLDNFGIPTETPLYNILCGLFSRMHDQASRNILSAVFKQLCASDDSLAESARICEELNAAGDRLDEPDLERREIGFTTIYEKYDALSVQQWQPIVHNCLFYIKDPDDLVNRSSASRGLERFIDAASRNADVFKPMVADTIMPGLEYGMKQSSELVRAEYLRLIGHLVENLTEWGLISGMKVLTVSGDDEASFFTNALHIQQHRRLRALRRLSDEAGNLSSNQVTKIFVPLLEHFIFDAPEGDAGRTLADQTVSTLGALAKVLNWSSFRATYKRYAGYLSTKEDHVKVVLRLLTALVDALSSGSDKREDFGSGRADIIARDLLPPLVEYLHLKDESTVDRRMPVAVTIVKLLMLLPEQEMALRLAPVLTDVCHVLRSRSQEARDETRKALAGILALAGPAYFGFILKELRGALQRGYQLHVLSFTAHSLLVKVIEDYRPGDLDQCLGELVTIIMDDIFGVIGQEKDAEEYRSAMKEIKSSKSFDTMELLAKVTPVQRLGVLIRPVRALLLERLDSKMVGKIENLMTRLRKGIDQNPAAESREMLMFCHEVVRQVYAEHQPTKPSNGRMDNKVNRYLVQKEPGHQSKSRTATAAQTFKLVSFALNLLRKVLRRHDDLLTPSNLAGFLPIAGDALVQGQEEVQLSALRLLGTIMRVPLPELESNALVYVKEAVRFIKTSNSMTTDSSKAALELITAVLREKRSVSIKDKDIGEVLKVMKTDIDEPDRQGIIYKFLRAVLGRKLMITEVYEIMDEVAKVVVTNADRNVRESARSAYLQFITDYPQGKDRWNKQATFFVENLKYEHSAGRQSVMELLHQLLSKVPEDVVNQLALPLFVALVPVQVSDPIQECRQMAGILIGKLFELAGQDQVNSFVTLMERWVQNGDNSTIQNASLQCWTILLRTRTPGSKPLASVRGELDSLLTVSDLEDESDGFLVQSTLQTFETLVDVAPKVAFARESASIWKALQKIVTQQHADVKTTAARLLGVYFSNVASASSKAGIGLSAVPLRGSEGLELAADDMRQMCYGSLRALRNAPGDSNESFVAQIVRNLVFLGRCFASNGIHWRSSEVFLNGDTVDDEDDAVHDKDPSAIAYLFNRLSYIIRADKPSVLARIAAVDGQIALINHVSAVPDINTVVRSLYVLTDPSIPRPPSEAYSKLVEKAQELLDVIQKKIGTQPYLSVLGGARAAAKAKREERRQKRKIEAVSAPEKWAKEKRKKYDNKKLKTKERGLEARGKRRGW
ncbi:U3 snoRNP protein [Vermiconidia calcicola]|uniref:U3 snoRNP protein n=1 Tax=Vermiconidia calcicola TaxID=1690605 RepID=A0ACC3NJJ3_9PEZI|nr:U3 snoRNP protein [Vermiconidia calcicola]